MLPLVDTFPVWAHSGLVGPGGLGQVIPRGPAESEAQSTKSVRTPWRFLRRSAQRANLSPWSCPFAKICRSCCHFRCRLGRPLLPFSPRGGSLTCPWAAAASSASRSPFSLPLAPSSPAWRRHSAVFPSAPHAMRQPAPCSPSHPPRRLSYARPSRVRSGPAARCYPSRRGTCVGLPGTPAAWAAGSRP